MWCFPGFDTLCSQRAFSVSLVLVEKETLPHQILLDLQ